MVIPSQKLLVELYLSNLWFIKHLGEENFANQSASNMSPFRYGSQGHLEI